MPAYAPIQLKLMPTPIVTAELRDPNDPAEIVARIRGLARTWDQNTGQLSTVYHQFARELRDAMAYRRK